MRQSILYQLYTVPYTSPMGKLRKTPQNKSHRNGKDTKVDLKKRSVTKAHIKAMAKREAFMQTYLNLKRTFENVVKCFPYI